MFQGNVLCHGCDSSLIVRLVSQNTQEQCCVCKQKIVGDCVVNNKTFYHPACMKVSQSLSSLPHSSLSVPCVRWASEKLLLVLSKQTNMWEAFQGDPGNLLCVRRCDRGNLLPAQRQHLLWGGLPGTHGRHLRQVQSCHRGGTRQDYRVKLSPVML